MPAPYPHKVRFLRLSEVEDDHGGFERAEAEVLETRVCMIFKSGSETGDAGALRAKGMLKIKMRSSAASRGLIPSDVMIDRDDLRYNIRTVDAVTDASHVWLDVEFGVATEREGGA